MPTYSGASLVLQDTDTLATIPSYLGNILQAKNEIRILKRPIRCQNMLLNSTGMNEYIIIQTING